VSLSRGSKFATDRAVLAWMLRILAGVFQLVSAHATYAGALKFAVDSLPVAAVITFAIQFGLLLTVHILVTILSGEQKERTSVVPPLLAILILLPLSVFFSAFGFYQHYGLAQGNRVAEFRQTTAEVRTAAADLDRYRLEALGYLAGEANRREAEKKRQEVRAASTRFRDATRAAARIRAAQLDREIRGLRQAESALRDVDVAGSATRETPEAMRRDLLAAQRVISNAVAQNAPDYMRDQPIPQPIPAPPHEADVQEGFFRDLRLRAAPALTTFGLASIVDFLSALFILCAVKVSTTEERILSFKRKVRRIFRATFPLRATSDTFTPVNLRARGVVSCEFVVQFERADHDLTVDDLTANLPAIAEHLNRARQVRIEIEGAYNNTGEELSPGRPLFAQLGTDKTVHLRVALEQRPEWPEEVEDEAA
jgi:hypothetical protein